MLAFEAPREFRSFLVCEIAVHHRERLGWYDRCEALRTRAVKIGKIERREQRMLKRSLQLDVETAARPRFFGCERPHFVRTRTRFKHFARHRRQHRRATDGGVERAIRDQHRVAQFFRGESTHTETRQQFIRRVLRERFFRWHARHAIRA